MALQGKEKNGKKGVKSADLRKGMWGDAEGRAGWVEIKDAGGRREEWL